MLKTKLLSKLAALAIAISTAAPASAADPLLTFDPVGQSTISYTSPYSQPIGVGDVLYGTSGDDWPWPRPNISYSWLRDSETIAGATSMTYAVQEADAGHHIKFRITGTQDGYNDLISTSEPTAQIVMPNYTITGAITVGKTVSVVVPALPNITYKYQWFATDSYLIPGATKSTYKIADSLAGSTYLNVRVSAFQGTAMVGERLITGPVTSPVTGGKNKPVSFGVSISRGYSYVGGTLTGNISGNSLGADCSRTWLRDGKARLVSQNNGQNYLIQPADAGHKIVLKVSCSFFGRVGSTVKTATSPKIVKGPQDVGAINVTGDYVAGQTLSASPGVGWSSGAVFSYQWFKDGKAISGAKTSNYTLPLSFIGHRISVKVTAKKFGYDDAYDTTPRALIG